jgi:hypothetical protein
MKTPKVSFVVPCYKLAHLLPECLASILSQTYTDFEVLILDDQSPDDTEGVARACLDPRVRYIRNGENLGNLRNYNKGISLCRGEYIWLISADDVLRRPYVLERYVHSLDGNPSIGYAFCPAVRLIDGKEDGVLPFSLYARGDRIVPGLRFAHDLLKSNIVVAASALVRRECYRQVGDFPLDAGMEWSGDWYLWCAFALRFDVAYFAEPMVCYRMHGLSMTSTLAQQDNLHRCSAGDLAVPLMIRKDAQRLKQDSIVRQCLHAIAAEYTQQCRAKRYQGSVWRLAIGDFEKSLADNVESPQERDWIRARVFEGVADGFWSASEPSRAREMYWRSARLRSNPLRPYLKLVASLALPARYARMAARYLP